MHRFRIHEMVFGFFLASAIWALGFVLQSSQPAKPPSQTQSASHTPNEASKGEDEKSLWKPSDPVSLYTLVLAFFSGLLVVVSFIQIRFLTLADRTARISAIAARRAANAARKSAGVAEQALYGTEAPFIFIIIGPTDGTAIVTVTSPQGVEYPEDVKYVLHNYGRSPAIIREIYLVCIASDIMPGPCHYPPLQSNIFQSEIVGPSGSSEPKPLPQIASWLPNDGKIHQWASVFSCGNVRYADVFGNQYVSGFCYAFNAHSKRFYAIGGANHNYRRKLTEDENQEAEKRDIFPSLNKS